MHLLSQEFFQMSPPHLSSALLTTASLIQLGAWRVVSWSKGWHISCSHISHETRASISGRNKHRLHISN
jgi:hypothetical protein